MCRGCRGKKVPKLMVGDGLSLATSVGMTTGHGHMQADGLDEEEEESYENRHPV